MKSGATGATTGSSTPSAKDASTQGADTAGQAEKKGDATTPGGTIKLTAEVNHYGPERGGGDFNANVFVPGVVG
jgi:hypothetical protein